MPPDKGQGFRELAYDIKEMLALGGVRTASDRPEQAFGQPCLPALGPLGASDSMVFGEHHPWGPPAACKIIETVKILAIKQHMNLYRQTRKFAWQVSMLGLDCGPHVTRYYMYNRFKMLGQTLQLEPGRVLSISHSDKLASLLGVKASEVVLADYPEHNLLSLSFPDCHFDYVLSDQVLEHVEGDPHRAVSECHRVLRPGGISILTTCFINPIHACPKDFWRFTPDALSLLHQDWSEIIEVGGWGNFATWSLVQDGLRFTGVPNAKWHPLHKIAMHNDPLWPIVTWIIARK